MKDSIRRLIGCGVVFGLVYIGGVAIVKEQERKLNEDFKKMADRLGDNDGLPSTNEIAAAYDYLGVPYNPANPEKLDTRRMNIYYNHGMKVLDERAGKK